MNRQRFTLLAIAVVCVFAALFFLSNRPSTQDQIREARRLMREGEMENAYQVVSRAVQRDPESIAALRLMAITSEKLDDLTTAINCYQQVANLSATSTVQAKAHFKIAKIFLKQADLDSAEEHLRTALIAKSDDADSLRELSTLLLKEGRHQEARSFLFLLVQRGNFHLDELVMLGSAEEFLEDRDLLERALQKNSESAVARLGLGSLEAFNGNFESAIDHLELAIQLNPNLSQAWATLGKTFHESGQHEKLKLLGQAIPRDLIEHPETQYIMGLIAEKEGQLKIAAQQYGKALQQNPDHRAANYRLGNLLATAGERLASIRHLERAQQLDDLERDLHRILFRERDLGMMKRCAQVVQALGRPTETWAWWLIIAHLHPSVSDEAMTNASSFQEKALSATSLVSQETQAELRMSLDQSVFPERGDDLRDHAVSGNSQILFQEIGKEVGLTEPYYGGVDKLDQGLAIYQGFGGGVGVLDYDMDHRPDLYFVHGNRWPILENEPRSQNRLYRTIDNSLSDVSEVTGTADFGFGQGVSIGDANSDGFHDIYVANIGANQLYLNNGDGTFSKPDNSEIEKVSKWTTSCLVADLNGDGFDDLYDVNYLKGNEPFTKECLSGSEQLIRTCKPDLFEGEVDRLLISSGDGSFQDRTIESGVQVCDGKGLGIVAADFDQSGTVDVFISNDSTPNTFLKNYGTQTSEDKQQFEDVALLVGVAVNGIGKSEASMGIAAGDTNNNGRLDLFVTNFYLETNTSYNMLEETFFIDRTDSNGLGESSILMLSFGTQFLDADLDGHLDLAVLNGHVDNYSHLDIPWKMRPQFYRNQGDGHFKLVAGNPLGDYSKQRSLGRALAKLDWNNDGMEDLVATHLDGTPALLMNHTEDAGNAISFKLVGTRSSRLGTGAMIEVHTSSHTLYINQTAGDGYFCSNEKKLTLGLGGQSTASQVIVNWPSGIRQEFSKLDAGATWIITEGSPDPLRVKIEK